MVVFIDPKAERAHGRFRSVTRKRKMIWMRGLFVIAFSMVSAAPLVAQPAEWDGPPTGAMGPPPGYDYDPGYNGRYPGEGRMQVATFVANSPAAATLGHGSIVISPAANGSNGLEDGLFEAALADQLAGAGYRTDAPSSGAGQTIEFVVSHQLVEPPEPRHSPVSGGVAVGAGSRGWSGVGLGIGIDLSKPRGPLVATRIEARIHDAATHELLWQGRAEVLAREGAKHWTERDIAAKLTAALFKGFPRPIAG